VSGPLPGEPGSSGESGPGRPGSWEIVERREVYSGFFSLDVLWLRHRLFSGGWSPMLKRELFRNRRAGVILPYDPVLDVVVLIEQFRTGALGAGQPPWMIEACAGLTEPGESPEEVARRECVEECGLLPRRLAFCCEYAASPGSSTEWVDVFVGEVTAPEHGAIHGIAAEGEDIRTHVLALDEALALVRDRRIVAVTAVISLLWLQANRAALRREWLSG
jgi:ADP-ribose pyrophosphatase